MGVGDITGKGGPSFNDTDRYGRIVLVTLPYSQFRGMSNPGLAMHVFSEIHSLARFGTRKFNKNFKEKTLEHGECVFFVRKFCREFGYSRTEVTKTVKALAKRYYWTVTANKDGFDLKVKKLSKIPEITAAQVIHLGQVNESISAEVRRDILKEQLKALARMDQGLSQADFSNLLVNSETYNTGIASAKPGSEPVQGDIHISPKKDFLANCVKGLPNGTLVSDSVAEAPSSAPDGALKGQKVGLTAETTPELAEVPGELNSGQCEVPHDSKIGELSEGWVQPDPKKIAYAQHLKRLIKSGVDDISGSFERVFELRNEEKNDTSINATS